MAAPAERVAELSRRYLEAQLVGDRREAMRVILNEGLKKGVCVRDLQVHVVQAAQREIGRLWQQNLISIAQEHMATAISQVAMSRLFEEAIPDKPLGKRVMVACVQGELHEFPSRLVADFLELGGFNVLYLGADVPTDDLMKMLHAEKPDLLALSVTMSFNVASLRSTVERVRGEFPDLPIMAGGHALAWEPELASRFNVETCGPEASELVKKACGLLHSRGRGA